MNNSKSQHKNINSIISPKEYEDLSSKIVKITPENINDCKKFIDDLKKKNVDLTTLSQKQSLKILKESGFFNFDFLEKNPNAKSTEIPLSEIKKAFKIIGGSEDILPLSELKKKMHLINPKFPLNEVSALTNGKNEIKAKEIFEILKENEIQDFNCAEEIFNLLDHKEDGAIDIDYISDIMRELKLANIDDKDKEILFKCLDLDRDNKITLSDFKNLQSKINLDDN